jgi:hypothetical protein
VSSWETLFSEFVNLGVVEDARNEATENIGQACGLLLSFLSILNSPASPGSFSSGRWVEQDFWMGRWSSRKPPTTDLPRKARPSTSAATTAPCNIPQEPEANAGWRRSRHKRPIRDGGGADKKIEPPHVDDDERTASAATTIRRSTMILMYSSPIGELDGPRPYGDDEDDRDAACDAE